MQTLKIRRETIKLEDTLITLIGMAVEKILGENADFRFKYKTAGSFNDMKKGILGLDTTVYEVENEGTIVYEELNVTMRVYASNIHFLGFNPKSTTYTSLKSQLEDIANTQDFEKVKAILKH